MAIICCATPSDMYLEETRSTLQFASRAKLVKTRATINEVLDDRSMIKKLQRELAVAKRAANGDIDLSQIRELESEATKAETNAKQAQEKYERLKASILKGGMFQTSNMRGKLPSSVPNGGDSDGSYPSSRDMERKRRRQSDGIVLRNSTASSPLLDISNRRDLLATLTPVQVRKSRRSEEYPQSTNDSGSFQILLLREALAAKGEMTRTMENKLNALQETADQYENSLNAATTEIDTIRKDHVAQTEILTAEKEEHELQRQDIMDELKELSQEKDNAIKEALSTIEKNLQDKESLTEKVASLEAEKIDDRQSIADFRNEKEVESERMQQEQGRLREEVENLQGENQDLHTVRSESEAQIEKLQSENQDLLTVRSESEAQIEKLQGENQGLHNAIADVRSEKEADKMRMQQEQGSLREEVEKLQGENQDLLTVRSENEAQIENLQDENQGLHNAIAKVRSEKDGESERMQQEQESLREKVEKLKDENQDLHNAIADVRSEKEVESERMQHEYGSLREEVEELKAENQGLHNAIADVRSENEADKTRMQQEQESLCEEVEKLKDENQGLLTVRSESEAQIENLQGENQGLHNAIADVRSEKEVQSERTQHEHGSLREEVEKLKDENQGLLTVRSESEAQIKKLQGENQGLHNAIADVRSEKEVESERTQHEHGSLREEVEKLKDENQGLLTVRSESEAQIEKLQGENQGLHNAIADVRSEKEVQSERMQHEQGSLREEVEQLQQMCDKKDVEKQDIEIFRTQLSKTLDTVNTEKLRISFEVTEANDRNECLSKSNNALNDELQVTASIVNKLKSELKDGIQIAESLTLEKDLAQALANQLSNAEDSALMEIQGLAEQLICQEKEVAETKAKYSELAHSKQLIEQNLLQVQSDAEASQADNNTLAETNNALNEQKDLAQALANQLSNAEDSALMEIQGLAEQLMCQEKEVAETKAKYNELVHSKQLMEQNLLQVQSDAEASQADNNTLAETNNALNEQLSVLASTVAILTDDLANSENIAEKLMAEKVLSQAVAAQMSEAEDTALMEIQGLARQLSCTQTQLNETKIEGNRLSQSNTDMKGQIEAIKAKNNNLTETISALNEQITSLQDDLARGASATEHQKESLEKSNRVKYEELLQSKVAVEERFSQVTTKFEEENARSTTLVESNTSVSEKLRLLISTMAELNKIFSDDDCVAESFMADTGIAGIFEGGDSEFIEITGLVEHVRCMQSKVSDLGKENEHLLQSKIGADDLDQKLLQITIEKDTLEASWMNQRKLTESFQEQVHALKLEIDHNKVEIIESASQQSNSYAAERAILEEKLSSKDSESEQLSEEVQRLTNDLDDRIAELSSKDSEAKQLSKEVQRLKIDLDDRIAELNDSFAAERAIVEEKLSSKDSESEQLSEKVQRLKNDLDDRIAELSSKNSEAEQLSEEVQRLKHDLHGIVELSSKDSEAEQHSEEVQRLKIDLDDRITELSEMSMNHSIMKQKLLDVNKELQVSQKDLEHLLHELGNKDEKSSDNDQILELQQLLASANAREEEARNIALETDEELERKERDLEETVLYATECEAAMKDCEEKYRALESRNLSPSNQDAEEILKEMELLMEEKMNVENQLESSKAEFDITEQELKNRFGEERRELLQEAETMMNQLRDSLSSKEEELEKHKRDARTTREELVAIQEQLKSDHSVTEDADEKVAVLTEMLFKAETTSSQLKSDLQNLQEEYNSIKEHTKASKESFKQSSDSKLAAVRDELASLRENLHQETSRARSFEEKSNLYEKELLRLETEMASTKQSLLVEKDFAVSKLKEEIAVARVELSRSQADIFSLEQELEDYKELTKKQKHRKQNEVREEEQLGKYKQLWKDGEEAINAKNMELDKSARALASYQDEIETLQESAKDVKKKLKTKDERIKSLEAKRMTKEHVALIKRLKVSPTPTAPSPSPNSMTNNFFLSR
jgi:centromeric protein E